MSTCQREKFVRKTEETYRPRELEREPDGVGEARHGDVRAQVDDVLAEDGCDDVAVRARRRRVDLHLILLQAHPEPGLADARALAGLGRAARAALTQTVLPVLVHERLQPQLEHPRGVYLETEEFASTLVNGDRSTRDRATAVLAAKAARKLR